MRHQADIVEVGEEESEKEVLGYLKNQGAVEIQALLSNRRMRHGGIDAHPESFNKVIWRLAIKGILYPTKTSIQTMAHTLSGDGYKLTDYGKTWIEGLKESSHSFLLSSTTSRSKVLAEFNEIYGQGYRVRSQEALACYESRQFLACCVMCGASTESIMLRAAIEKSGDEDKILQIYREPSGFRNIVKYLTDHEDKKSKNRISRLMEVQDVMQYWRNESAHGKDTDIEEPEADRALHLLHRFALFAKDNWSDLTTNN